LLPIGIYCFRQYVNIVDLCAEVAMDIRIERSDRPIVLPPPGELGFGRVFSDHMLRAHFARDRGWHDAAIAVRAPIALDPAASGIQYGQSVFEGLKAYRLPGGEIALFRPDVHARRFVESARRICLPEVPAADFVEGVRALVEVDEGYVPSAPGTSLYIRPTLIGTEGFLGVRPSHTAEFFVIATAVGPYWQGGRRPLRIWLETEFVRAARGGSGAAKFGGNYAASLLAAEHAKARGFDQVLWTDAANRALVEEIGTMNVFVRLGDTVVTPPLEGTILAGVTRDCVLVLLREWGIRVEERAIASSEIERAAADGSLREMFGTGTAAVVAPIGRLGFGDREWVVGSGDEGELTRRLYETVSNIQSGALPDPYGWRSIVRPGSMR
jgi:branched-chain amino acid aminotransferase